MATVFGCTGFLGRYLVHKLAKQGTQVVVPYRDEDSKRFLRVMGDLGQIVPLVSLTRPTTSEARRRARRRATTRATEGSERTIERSENTSERPKGARVPAPQARRPERAVRRARFPVSSSVSEDTNAAGKDFERSEHHSAAGKDPEASQDGRASVSVERSENLLVANKNCPRPSYDGREPVHRPVKRV